MKTAKMGKMKIDKMTDVSTLFLRAKTKQAKNAKNHGKSERSRCIFKGIMAMDIEWEGVPER